MRQGPADCPFNPSTDAVWFKDRCPRLTHGKQSSEKSSDRLKTTQLKGDRIRTLSQTSAHDDFTFHPMLSLRWTRFSGFRNSHWVVPKEVPLLIPEYCSWLSFRFLIYMTEANLPCVLQGKQARYHDALGMANLGCQQLITGNLHGRIASVGLACGHVSRGMLLDCSLM